MLVNWNDPNTALQLKMRDPAYCEQLYADWRNFIRRTGRENGLSEDLLDDLVQEVLLSLIGPKGCRFDPARGSFFIFLKRITKLRSIDLLRRLYRRMNTLEKIRMTAMLDEEAFVPEWVAARPDQEKLLQKMLLQLQKSSSALHYQIFCRVMLREEKVNAVAEEYKMPLPTVYSIVGRMTVKLRKVAASFQEP